MNKLLAIGLMFVAINAVAKHDSSNGCGCSGSKPPARAPAPTPAPAPSPAPAPTPAPAKGSITTPTPASGGSWKPWNDPQLCKMYPQMCAPVEYKLAEPPQLVYVDRTVEVERIVEVPVITTVEVERIVAKIVEVPVYNTVNVCPVVPAKPKPAIIRKPKLEGCK